MYLRLEKRINASADSAWKVLGKQFADIDDWATLVQSSRPLELQEIPTSMTVAPTAPFGFMGKIMKRRMATTFGGILDDLKRHVEATQA